MTKPMGVQNRLHRVVSKIIQIILWNWLWFTDANQPLCFGSLQQVPELNTENIALHEITSDPVTIHIN